MKGLTIMMVAVVTILMMEVHRGMAVVCVPTNLEPCMPFFMNNSPPPPRDSQCCVNVRNMDGCYCEFLKDPKYGKYLRGPNAKKVGNACVVKEIQLHEDECTSSKYDGEQHSLKNSTC
ncbi:hypothetical protein LXL04_006163 [Taraxacum kok-saghyz]